MVHLPPDSRLLASLVKQEQAYSSQLYNLLNTSNSALSALVIYASSSPTEISNTLRNVANALSGVDDAFRNYGEAINNWVDQLRSINRKEEEVANIGRQRELLVTRLIKVSQKSKASPQSLLHSASDSASNVSFKSFNSKVSASQMELQACESHLATQERELETFRLSALKHGLRLRCQALVQCAWVWGELGRRCLSFLDELTDVPSPNGAPPSGFCRPLTNGVYDRDRDSTLSSLAPSQSASQIGTFNNDTQMGVSPHVNLYSLNIPPPHLVPENGNIPVPSPTKPQSQQHQADESTSSEADVPVEVHENPKYKRNSVLDRARGSVRRGPESPQGSPSRHFRSFGSDNNQVPQSLGTKDRKNHGLFSGLASLFKTSAMSGKSSQNVGWDTRTDRNVRGVKTDVEASSDEERSNIRKLSKRRSRSVVPHSPIINGSTSLAMPSSASTHQPRSRTGSLKRTGTVRSTVSEPPVMRVRERAATLTTTTGHHLNLYIPPERRLSSDGKPRSLINIDQRRPSPSQHAPPSQNSSPSKGEGLSRIAEDTSLPDGSFNPPPSSSKRPGTMPASTNLPPAAAPSVHVDSGFSSMVAQNGGRRHATNFSRASTVGGGKPLKSVLRNTSRERDGSVSPYPPASVSSSSPAKPPVVLPATPISQAPAPPRPLTPISPVSSPLNLRPNLTSSPVPPTSQQSSGVGKATATATSADDRPSSPRSSISETASISSYETGRENFDDENDGVEEQQEGQHNADVSAVPVVLSQPRLIAPTPQPSTHLDLHEISSMTSGDTTIANDPALSGASGSSTRRRKSVRMSSLPPQVLERTPTQEDYEGGLFTSDQSKLRSSVPNTPVSDSGWNSRPVGDASNVWMDSSSEDEGYKEAKRALTRTKRHSSIVRK